ncbi:MAG: fibronectin type III domain-containing protein [Candidatus Saccharicenans sp.]|uniref:fibronectin type III domain-containing protein n=1 Tax=Candidatus Saccharicenans sp. TaxID=2819258 RepID=UPI00404B5D26
MKKIFPPLASCLLILLLSLNSGCGHKGQLQEPVPRKPQAVRDLRIIQQGARLIFTWSGPLSYLSGAPLEIARVEIRALEIKGEETSEKRSPAFFLKYSRPLPELRLGQLEAGIDRASLSLDLNQAAGRKFLFGLLVRGKKGGWSDLSNLVAIQPEVLPAAPLELRAEIGQDRIVLSWEAPPSYLDGRPLTEKVYYNLYRAEDGDFRLLNRLPLGEAIFTDLDFSFGRTYRYLVRAAVVRGGELREGSDPEILVVRAEDEFPPGAPAGVRAVAGEEGVALSWLPNSEKDLAGYRVYRWREGEAGPVTLTPDLLTVPVFLDRSVEKQALYVYSIKAVDKSGNESPPAKIQVKT